MSYRRSTYLPGTSSYSPSRTSSYSRVSDYTPRSSYTSGVGHSSSSGVSDYTPRSSYTSGGHSSSYSDFKPSYSSSYSSSPSTDSYSRRNYNTSSSYSSTPSSYTSSSYLSRSKDVTDSPVSYRSPAGGSTSQSAGLSTSGAGEDMSSYQARVDKVSSIEELQVMLKNSDNFEERKILRSAIRTLRDREDSTTQPDNMTSYRSYRSSDRSDPTTTTSSYRSTRSMVLSPGKETKEEKDYTLIQDEDELRKLLNESDDYFEKKKIRAALRELRKKQEESSSNANTHVSPRLSNRSKEEAEEKQEQEKKMAETNTAPSSTEQKVNEETDILNSSGDMSLMENLHEHLERLRLKLEETKDLDKRREIRTAMRELRAQIREGKMQPNSRELLNKNKESTPTPTSTESTEEDKSADHEVTTTEVTTTEVTTTEPQNVTEDKPSVKRPESLGVVVKTEEDGALIVEDTQKVDDTLCKVKMRTKHSRTTSQSDVFEKSTTLTKEIMSPGGTKFIEQDDVVTRTKKSCRGSMYNETDMTMKKMVRTKSGSEYAETDILIETDSSSVSTGEKTSNVVEMKVTHEKPSDLSLTSIEEGKELDLDKNGGQSVKIGESTNRSPTTTTLESSGYGSGDEADNNGDNVFDSPVKERASAKIVTGLSDKSVFDGDAVVLECTVASAGADTAAVWYRNDEVLKESKDFVQSFDGHIAKLVICEVFPDDSGCYRCALKSGDDVLETSCNLTVQDNPNLTAPSFTKHLTDLQTLDGDAITFVAEVKGQPDPIIKWHKGRKLLKNCADYQQKYDGNKATLVIDEVFPEDTGEYCCAATNEAGEVKSTCILTVAEKPAEVKTIKPAITTPLSDKTVTDGDNVILECTVTGTPEPNVVWYRKDKVVKESGDFKVSYDGSVAKLVITEVFPDDAGLYECVAENSAGEVSTEMNLTVKDVVKKIAPKITKELTNLTIKDGEPATFECSVTGEPEPEIVWRRGDRVIRKNLDTRITFKDGTALLELGEALLPKDAGKYTCCAKNDAGEVTSSCSLVIEEYDLEDDLDKKFKVDLFKFKKVNQKMATMDNLDTIDVEEPLQKLLNDTSDFDDRKKIRARIRAVKEVKRQEREQERQKRESNRQDEVKRRFQLAQEEKQARMKRFDDMAKEKTIGASSNLVESHIREKHKVADEKKQKVLREFEEKAAKDSIGKIGQQSEGALQTRIQVAQDMKKDKLESMSKVSTGFHINNNNQKAVSTSTFGGVVYGKAPESTAESIAQKLKDEGRPGSSGSVTIKQESWSSKTGLKKTETTKTWGAKPQGTKGAMAAFKQMDQAANPAGGRPK